jgi:maltooligosyltrehalose trehalohydrolase
VRRAQSQTGPPRLGVDHPRFSHLALNIPLLLAYCSPMIRSEPWSLGRGAQPRSDGSVEFEVWAPAARRLELVIEGRSSDRGLPLERDQSGVWRGRAADLHPGQDYWYRVNGEAQRPDPASRYRPKGVHGPSRIIDPADFQWTDDAWQGLPTRDRVIYELHVGTFTPEGTFDGVISRLEPLRELGVTAIELMPVAEFPGTRNWGYDGVSLYAPQSSYGGPEGLRRLVNAAHRTGLAVILDVVYNHLGPEGNYLRDFGPYFTDRYRTLWGDGWNLDGPDSDEVRRYILDNALYWITEFHLDGLRLDAADTIVDQSAMHILEELTAAVHRQAARLGRRVSVIAETAANDPRFVRTPEVGGYGLDAQWSDDFHHAVHVALTREQNGYYADFGGVAPVAKALAERFVNDGRYSVFRRRRHGRPALDLPPERFVICVQNHDQVGNRARGERLTTLVPAEALRLAAAILLLSPYVPLLFMGEEYGESRPFLYFVSHGDPKLVEAVRDGRRREFAGFGWSGEIPDPQAESTFEASRLDWDAARRPPHAQLRALYRDLLELRRALPLLQPGVANVRVSHDAGAEWVALDVSAGTERLLGGFNFAAEERQLPIEGAGSWDLVFSSDAAVYGGGDRVRLTPGQLALPGLSAALLRPSSA